MIVTIELGPQRLEAFARVGTHDGPAFAFEAPPAAAAPGFWQTDECREIVLEILALMHLPHIDRLAIALPPASVAAASPVLADRYAGRHVVRNTECRSQVLEVNVREVVMTPLAAADPVPAGAQPA